MHIPLSLPKRTVLKLLAVLMACTFAISTLAQAGGGEGGGSGVGTGYHDPANWVVTIAPVDGEDLFFRREYNSLSGQYELCQYSKLWVNGYWTRNGVPIGDVSWPVSNGYGQSSIKVESEGTMRATFQWIGQGPPPPTVRFVANGTAYGLTGSSSGSAMADNGMGDPEMIVNEGWILTTSGGKHLREAKVSAQGIATFEVDKKASAAEAGPTAQVGADAAGLQITIDSRMIRINNFNGAANWYKIGDRTQAQCTFTSTCGPYLLVHSWDYQRGIATPVEWQYSSQVSNKITIDIGLSKTEFLTGYTPYVDHRFNSITGYSTFPFSADYQDRHGDYTWSLNNYPFLFPLTGTLQGAADEKEGWEGVMHPVQVVDYASSLGGARPWLYDIEYDAGARISLGWDVQWVDGVHGKVEMQVNFHHQAEVSKDLGTHYFDPSDYPDWPAEPVLTDPADPDHLDAYWVKSDKDSCNFVFDPTLIQARYFAGAQPIITLGSSIAGLYPPVRPVASALGAGLNFFIGIAQPELADKHRIYNGETQFLSGSATTYVYHPDWYEWRLMCKPGLYVRADRIDEFGKHGFIQTTYQFMPMRELAKNSHKFMIVRLAELGP